MNTQILVSIVLLFFIILAIVLLRKKQSSKSDYNHHLSHAFKLTWEYFSTHPSTRDFTEVHSTNGSFQIFAHGTDDCHKYEVTIVYPNDPDVVYNKIIKGDAAERKVEDFILEKMNLQPDSYVRYQITGLGGPEVFYCFDK